MDLSESQGCVELSDHFAELTDPRRGKVTHPLLSIVTIAICAVICGADDFVAIAQFGRLKRKWLAKFLDLTNGNPSHDRFNQVLAAIPKLLQMLEIKGSLVTIDAMGCQVQIAQQIADQKADYVLAVKGNQPTLHDGVVSHFAVHLNAPNVFKGRGFHRTSEKAHGRETEREYFVCAVPDDLPDAYRWPKLKAIGMTVNCTLRDGKETIEGRYYIVSRKLTAKQFAEAVRGHWSIENSLHWQLDVTFGEDQCPIRKGNADTNVSLLRRHALSLLKNERTAKVGVKNKRLSAALDEDYLLKVLFRA